MLYRITDSLSSEVVNILISRLLPSETNHNITTQHSYVWAIDGRQQNNPLCIAINDMSLVLSNIKIKKKLKALCHTQKLSSHTIISVTLQGA